MIEKVFKPAGGWKPTRDYPLVFDKFKTIEKYIKGKDVLDCGCVGHEPEEVELHKKISGAASYCLGVDIQEQEVRKLEKDGYNVICSDVESLNLNKKFDVVFAGEIIEHLSNPGLFLERAKEHLKDDGRLILSTPNPHFFSMIFRTVLGKQISVNREHTSWHSPETIKQLLNRYGFTVEEVYWYQSSPRWWINFIVKYRRNLARSIMVVAKR